MLNHPHVGPTMFDASLGTQVANMIVADAACVLVIPVVKTKRVVDLVKKTIGLKMRPCLLLLLSEVVPASTRISSSSEDEMTLADLACSSGEGTEEA